jgi:hypothetical protein
LTEGESGSFSLLLPYVTFPSAGRVYDLGALQWNFVAKEDPDSADVAFALGSSSGEIVAADRLLHIIVPASVLSNLKHGTVYYGSLEVVHPLSGERTTVWIEGAPIIEIYVWGRIGQ